MSYALHDLDKKLLKYLNFNNGFFIEAGANDGISQSNTALYEFNYGWRGLLIEPNFIKYQQCKQNRINSIVENYALVSNSYNKLEIEGNFAKADYEGSLTAMVYDKGDWVDDNLLKEKEKIKDELISVPAITLTKLLDKHNIQKIDFISLDVEGYEISVLNGLDFKKFTPSFIMIETTTYEERKNFIIEYMKNKNYRVIEQLSINDFIFEKSS